MKIPKGYTEEQVLEIINRITSSLARKFKFGYHEIEDMKQQGIIIAIEGLEKYDEIRPLENFLWVHVHNRLFNFKRKSCGRPDKPCLDCPFKAYINNECIKFNNELDCELYAGWAGRNESKRDIMSTKDSKDSFTDTSEIDDRFSSKEIYEIIDKNIPVNMRSDWIRFIHKNKLTKVRRDELISTVLLILKENGIDTTQGW